MKILVDDNFSGIEIPMVMTSFPECLTKNNVNYKFNDGFKKHVLVFARKVLSVDKMLFNKYHFTKVITDSEIMGHFQISELFGLMTQEEILWAIASLTSKQPKGEEGFLRNNFHSTIIGYIFCNDNVIRVVSIFYNFHSGAEWYCECYDIDENPWYKDNEMLFRN